MAISKGDDTKTALLEAAGDLFATHGYGSTSIRMIAERAGANVAAINYHFGGKENLYAESLRRAVVEISGAGLKPWREAPERFQTPESIASLIRNLVRARFLRYFSPGLPSWHTALLMRSFLEPAEALQPIVRQIFEPELEALQAIMLRARPALTGDEALFHAFALTGLISIYAFAETPILMLMRKRAYDQAFLDEASEHVASIMLGALGLPTGDGGHIDHEETTR